MDAVLAWAVREGTTNVIRHSYATHCQIRLIKDGEQIHAEITDDGPGAPSEGNETYGSGLSSLAERVSANYGRFEAGSPPEGGFRLRVSLPLGTEPSTGPASRAEGTRRDERP